MSSIWLNSLRRNVTSQSGEDGVLEAIFERVGVSNKWCCELGALDGVTWSNTHALVAQRGWSGVLIECQKREFDQLEKNMSAFKATLINALVTPGNFEEILRSTGLPKDFDLLSLDVDGDDFFLWESLESYRPRVMVIEVFSAVPPGERMIPEKGPTGEKGDDRRGASISSMVELAKRKGYELALHTASPRPPEVAPCWGGGGNAIFVLRELGDKLGIDASNWQELFDPSWVYGGI